MYLQKSSFYWPQSIPPNDGGLASGQLLAAWHYLADAEVPHPVF
ncbi:MAG: hypothetical protein AAGN15_08705 [Cyanobacteria bacterium J06581_3]